MLETEIMKIKNLALVILLFFGILACTKEDKEGVVGCIPGPACLDTVPNEACLAAFSRYFYNSETGSCEQISYSGCKAYGFETLTECEECDCTE